MTLRERSFPPSLGEVNFRFFLAPMVGLTHVGLRSLVRSYLPKGCQTFFPTEMLNSRRIPLQELGSTPETYRGADENDLVPQILANEEQEIQLSMAKLERWGVKGVDINMGCPVKKALKHNYGVALMGDPHYAAEVVRMAVRASSLPVSVKLRAGLQKDLDYLKRFLGGLEEAGASWICLHPRMASQRRRGNADWSQILEARRSIGIPLIGNGDVQTGEDALALKEICDGVMIGRALTARPWLFWQIGERLGMAPPSGREGERAPQGPEEEANAYLESLGRLLDILDSRFEEGLGLRKFRFHLHVSHAWLNYGHELKRILSRCQTYEEAKDTVLDLKEKGFLRMSARTELRY